MTEGDHRPGRRVPRTSRALVRGLLGRCPACGAGNQIQRWLKVRQDCPQCGLHYERIEGHFIGAIGINTVVSFTVMLISLVVSLILTFPEFPLVPLLAWNLAVAIVVPTLFLPLSRTLWTAIDIAMRPLTPDEVDWSVVLPANPPKVERGRSEA